MCLKNPIITYNSSFWSSFNVLSWCKISLNSISSNTFSKRLKKPCFWKPHCDGYRSAIFTKPLPDLNFSANFTPKRKVWNHLDNSFYVKKWKVCFCKNRIFLITWLCEEIFKNGHLEWILRQKLHKRQPLTFLEHI